MVYNRCCEFCSDMLRIIYLDENLIHISKTKLSLLYYLYILVYIISLVATGQPCLKQEDCNNERMFDCGICIDNDNRRGGKCYFPFPYMFEENKNCAIRTVCDENCNNHGECRNIHNTLQFMPVIPSCLCNENFYGRTCHDSTPQDLVGYIFRYISIGFKGLLNVNEVTYLHFFVACEGLLHESMGLLEVECDDGRLYETKEINNWKCGERRQYIEYTIATKFPYKPLNDDVNEKFLLLGNTIVGYLRTCTIKLFMAGTINFQLSIGVFVSYKENNLICVPIVQISGCASTKEYSTLYTQLSHIKLASTVYYIDDGRYVDTSKIKMECKENANYHWRIWINRYHDEVNNMVLQYYSVKELSFDPMSLKIGYYRVLLEVTSVQEEPSKNFAYCYFNISITKLVAIIDGGSERTVSKNVGLVLTTTKSHDSNRPLDKQHHMHASWSCIDITNPKNGEICDPRISLGIPNSYSVPSERLSYGSMYNITLKVWTNYYRNCEQCGYVAPAYANALITVANKTDRIENNIYIQCLLNCNEKVVHNQQLYLRVKTISGSKKTNNHYKWYYYEKGETGENDTKSIAIEGLPSFMLILKQNSLSSGKSYVIVVRDINLKLSAKYSFDTYKIEFEGNCSITPTSGIKGFSLFKIICENFSSSYTYEFYDKTSEEAQADIIFNGRMLGTAERMGKGELKDFRVTRGQVFVYIIDNSCLYTHRQFTVNLTDWSMSEEVISQVFKNLTKSLDQGEKEKMLRYISSITDNLPSETNKQEVLNKILHYIASAPADTLADIKLTTSTLNNALLTLNKPVQFTIEAELMRDTLHVLKDQAVLFSRIVGKGNNLNGMSPQEIKLVATGQLNCLYTVLKCKDPRTVGVTEFDFKLKVLDKLMDISIYAEDIIYLIKDILTFLQAPGQPPTKIALTGNSYVVWVVENDEEYDLRNYLSSYDDIPVNVSNKFIVEFGTDLRKNQEELALRVAVLDDNIFWWPRSDIKSNLISVSLAKHSKKENLGRIRFVDNAVNMAIRLNSDLNSTQVTDSTNPYDLGTYCSLDRDVSIRVHRIDPMPQSLIFLRFLFPQTNGSLLVHVHKDYRPDCEMMKKAVTITDKSPNYPPFVCSNFKPTFYFVAITPMNNQSVTYTFEINTTVCQFWTRGHWSSQGCHIINDTFNNFTANCACNHFSVFAAAFPVPPLEVDPFSEITLFLTVFDNPIVVCSVTILLLIYLICCVWARIKDRSDRNLRNIIILDDNFPGDRYPYLLTVYTSSRLNAGTTSHVGIQIEGSSASSRSHILASKKRKVLKRNFDDWFLINCPEPLGDLQSIHIWHDNTGSSPNWFCDKIIVYDLNYNSEFVFVVEQWIALQLTYFPEAIVRSASDYQVKSVKRIFLDNCVLGLREGHILLCIILRHPRSEPSRLQRISVLMCCVMASMLCSIMFYSPQVDDHEYNVGLRDFYVSIQSLLISLTTTFIVFFTFRRSYKYSKVKLIDKNKEIEYKGRTASIRKLEQQRRYNSFVRFVLNSLKGYPLAPVQLENSEPAVVLRKFWLYIAWFLCVSVIVICSFFVMLYGLKLGLVKSKIWLSSVIFIFCEDIFVTTPSKIILGSMILSFAFQKMSDTDKYRVDVRDVFSVTEENNVERLLVKRDHPMYKPVRSDVMYNMFKKKELWYNWWTLLDFKVALCFIFVVSILVFEMWSSHYYTNNQVKNIVTESAGHPSLNSENFFGIKTMSQINYYLKESIFQEFYKTFWYNKMLIEERGVDKGHWSEDFTHRMVGLLRYRQIRVEAVECRFKFINTTRHCIPHYKHADEDSESYGLRWKPAQWYDMERGNSPWKYTEKSTSSFYTSYRLCGKSGTVFHNGGYLIDLGQEWAKSHATAQELVLNKWQDQLTKAVFVEFTVYNINMDLYSQVTMIVEYLISGNIQLKAQVISVESKMKLSFMNALFVAFIIYYTIRTFYLINQQGLMEYLSSSSRNQSRLFVVFLGALSILVATIHFYSSTAYYKSFINEGYTDTYFDFDTLIYYFLLLKAILSCLLCLAIIRTMLIFRGGRTLLNYYYTFTISFNRICWLTMVLGIFLAVQILFVILLNKFTFCNIQEIIISSNFIKCFGIKGVDNSFVALVIFYVKLMSLKAFMGFYVVIFMHYTKVAQTYKVKKSDKFNLFLFFIKHIKKRKNTKPSL